MIDYSQPEYISNWDQYFLNLALQVARKSKDPSTKVGAILVNDRQSIISTGFNGFPRGVQDLATRYEDKPTKRLFVQHAERNALDQAECRVTGYSLYVTLCPCSECCKSIIQRGVTKVVCLPHDPVRHPDWEDSFNFSKDLLKEAGVTLVITDLLI